MCLNINHSVLSQVTSLLLESCLYGGSLAFGTIYTYRGHYFRKIKVYNEQILWTSHLLNFEPDSVGMLLVRFIHFHLQKKPPGGRRFSRALPLDYP